MQISKSSDIGARGWLALLSEADRARLLGQCVSRKSEPGTDLYRIGDTPDGLYYLVSGCIRMETVQSDHGPTMLNHFHAGSWLGEVELFSRVPRFTTLTVVRPLHYLFLSSAELETLGREQPAIWRALGHLASEHVALAVASLDDMAIRASDARLAAVLLRLAGARVASDPDVIITNLDVTQQELAQMSNLSRSMVGDILAEFERTGILDRRYGQLSLRDVSALRSLIAAEKS